jgi:O-antigen/teichoic acid export membrane protein
MNARTRRLTAHDSFASLVIMALRGGMLVAKFALALFLARFVGFEALGIYGLIAGAAAVGQVVMRAGLFTAISRDAIGQPLPALTRELRHYTLGCLLLYLALVPFAAAVGWWFEAPLLAALTLLIIFLEHAANDAFVLANNLRRPVLANALISLQSATWIYLYIAVAWLVPALRSVTAALMFWIGGGLLALVLNLALTRRWPWREAFAAPLQRGWHRLQLVRSWRLYAGEVIAVLTQYLDRYLITLFLTLELVGVYVLFWQVANAICNLVGAGELRTFVPQLVGAHRAGKRDHFRRIYRDCIRRALFSALLLSLACAALVPLLVRFTDEPLALAYLPLLWLMLAVLPFRIGSDLANSGMYVRYRDKFLLRDRVLKLLSATVAGAACLYLFGIYGAALASVLVYGASILYTAWAWDRTD